MSAPATLLPLLLLSLLLLSLLSASATHAHRARFNADAIRADFILVDGRPSACPQRLTVTDASPTAIPASGMTLDAARCTGVGTTVLSVGHDILRAGLPLPTALKQPTTRFLAGVDTAMRQCGRWTFNASSLTWFIANIASTELIEPATGATLSARRAHVLLTSLSDTCVLQATTELPSAVYDDNDIATATTADGAAADGAAADGAAADGAAADGTAADGESDYNTELAQHENAARAPSACFPADATVRLPGGASKRMRDLRIGDTVLVRDGCYSPVFALSHASPNRLYSFVRLATDNGTVVDVSEGHIMLARRGPTLAGQLQVGDELAAQRSDEWQRVVRVEHVWLSGLYNPHTMSGEIVVDGLLATTWTSAVPAVTASCALAPLRWWFRITPRRVATATGVWFLPAIETVQSIIWARSKGVAEV